MDIFNRQPSVAEDTLQYTIYPLPNTSDKTSVTTLATLITGYVESLLPGFVWHRDAFEVKVVSNTDTTGSWMLEGRMRVGDCVDDEWCAVWLLKQISLKWDTVTSVYDSDGEILLIEAAEALPAWVKPKNSKNRVWIHNSRLHLIPLTHISSSSRERRSSTISGAPDSNDENMEIEDEGIFLAAEDAVKLVRDMSIDTYATPDVEKIVWQRIAGYPSATQSHVHTTKSYIPEDIARALFSNNSLVQKAVETFYTRDATQLRAAHRMSRFPPNTSTLTSVKMTRTAYAQLVGQRFFPPKIFGQWKEPEGSKEWRWRDVGMKIAVGFEMLFQESKGRQGTQNLSADGINSSANANKEALQRHPDYQVYLQNLVAANYFKGEVLGSELWKSLENKAAATFVEVRRTDDASRQSFTSQVDAAISAVANLPETLDSGEDPDDWLTIDAHGFDQMLEDTLGGKKRDVPASNLMDVSNDDNIESTEDHIASEQASRLKDLARKVEDFVEGDGDLEGAMFDDEEFSDELLSDDEETSDYESDEDRVATTEEGGQMSAERQAAMDQLVPALAASDYGKMPASFHSNSQRVALEKVSVDGVDETSNNQKPAQQVRDDLKPMPRSIRPPVIPRDKYDGVDSDDETDEEDIEDEEFDEDRPQVVGDIEIDMGDEEEEFLEFSRQALGINDEQWSDIIKDRKDRGAFLPPSTKKTSKKSQNSAIESEVKTDRRPHTPRVPEPGPRPNVNPELDSFEAVMKALDEALAEKQSQKKSSKPAQIYSAEKGKGKETVEDLVDDDDIDDAMDAELKEALKTGEDADVEGLPDYNLIKNFLESFKSQGGLSGPVSSLAGRLAPDLKFPRDDLS